MDLSRHLLVPPLSLSLSLALFLPRNSSYPSRSAYASRDMPAGLGGRTSRGWRLPSAAAAAAAGAAAAAIDDVEPGGRAGAAPPPPRATPRMSLTSDMASFAASFESVCVPRAFSSRERGRERRERDAPKRRREKKSGNHCLRVLCAHKKSPKSESQSPCFLLALQTPRRRAATLQFSACRDADGNDLGRRRGERRARCENGDRNWGEDRPKRMTNKGKTLNPDLFLSKKKKKTSSK